MKLGLRVISSYIKHITQFSAQGKIALSLVITWLVVLTTLMLIETVPVMPKWTGPPHFTSSVVVTLAIVGLLLLVSNMSNFKTAWFGVICTCSIVIILELGQSFSTVRAVEFIDVINGFAGATVGGLLYLLGERLFGRYRFSVFAVIAPFMVLLLSPILWFWTSTNTTAAICSGVEPKVLSWSEVSIHSFTDTGDGIQSSLANFCTSNQNVSSQNGVLLLHGGGVFSGKLTGLSKAIDASKQLTFAVRFRSTNLTKLRRSSVIAAITVGGTHNLPLVRVHRLGKTISSTIRFSSTDVTTTIMSNRLSNDYHEIVITYDGKVQKTYLDNLLLGTVHTEIFPEKIPESLYLSIGRRGDARWEPFIGEISGVVIAAQVIDPKLVWMPN